MGVSAEEQVSHTCPDLSKDPDALCCQLIKAKQKLLGADCSVFQISTLCFQIEPAKDISNLESFCLDCKWTLLLLLSLLLLPFVLFLKHYSLPSALEDNPYSNRTALSSLTDPTTVQTPKRSYLKWFRNVYFISQKKSRIPTCRRCAHYECVPGDYWKPQQPELAVILLSIRSKIKQCDPFQTEHMNSVPDNFKADKNLSSQRILILTKDFIFLTYTLAHEQVTRPGKRKYHS